MPKFSSRAFTLIELLVVISIIAVLSAVGLVSYNGIRSKAMDAKIKSDLNAIKKAYEANYDPTANGGQGGYKQLSPTNDNNSPYFAGGKIPAQPNGSPYPCGVGPDITPSGSNYGCNVQNAAGYQVNGTLSGPTSSGTPISVISNQGTLVGTANLNTCDVLGTLKNNLVGNWKFDDATSGNTPTTVSDSSTNANTGTWNGSGNPHWVFGVMGGAGSFNGSDDYLSIANSASLQPLTGNWSVGFWLYRTGAGAGDYPQIIGSRPWNAVLDKGWSVAWSSGGNNICGHFADGSTGFDVGTGNSCSSATSTINTWEHWVVVFVNGINGKIYFYKNGSLNVSLTPTGGFPTGSINQTNTIYVARDIEGANNRKLAAKLDEIRVYSRALTAPEINLLFNNNIGCSP